MFAFSRLLRKPCQTSSRQTLLSRAYSAAGGCKEKPATISTSMHVRLYVSNTDCVHTHIMCTKWPFADPVASIVCNPHILKNQCKRRESIPALRQLAAASRSVRDPVRMRTAAWQAWQLLQLQALSRFGSAASAKCL